MNIALYSNTPMKNIFIKALLILALLCVYLIIPPSKPAVKTNTVFIRGIDSMFKINKFWHPEFIKMKQIKKISTTIKSS